MDGRPDNPDGPLTKDAAAEMTAGLAKDEESFYDDFTRQFFSVNGELKVTEQQRQEALQHCKQADKKAALARMEVSGATDFRDDLRNVTVPALVLHGDGDGTVPFEGSGARTHAALPGSELHVLHGATDDQGRPILYGKVATVAVVGNEDGAHKTIADMMQGLNDVGFTFPAQGGTYWVGEAMQTVDFKDLEHVPAPVASTNAGLARNAVHLAQYLKREQYPAG